MTFIIIPKSKFVHLSNYLMHTNNTTIEINVVVKILIMLISYYAHCTVMLLLWLQDGTLRSIFYKTVITKLFISTLKFLVILSFWCCIFTQCQFYINSWRKLFFPVPEDICVFCLLSVKTWVSLNCIRMF